MRSDQRCKSLMGIRGAGVALAIAVQEMTARANAAGRGLYEGEEDRPGRSDLAYVQHKYTPLDSRIIIITAAILLLLISILFLNFFIRWALHRLFLLRSDPKPMNPNKGLSKRQIQALPSFTYSSSKPPTHVALPPCGHPTFYPPFTLHSISSNFCHALHPTSISSTKVGEFEYQSPTKFEVHEGDQNTPSQLVSTQVHKVDNDPPAEFDSLERDQLASTHVDEVDNHPPAKFDSLEADHALEGNHSSKGKEEVVNNESSTKANVHNVDNEVKGNSSPFKGGDAIIDCTKNDEMARHCDDNASSSAPCPICLVEFVDGETIRVLPTCRHYFHIGCIDLWLEKSSSCPACRANLLEATRPPMKHSTLQVQVITTISH